MKIVNFGIPEIDIILRGIKPGNIYYIFFHLNKEWLSTERIYLFNEVMKADGLKNFDNYAENFKNQLIKIFTNKELLKNNSTILYNCNDIIDLSKNSDKNKSIINVNDNFKNPVKQISLISKDLDNYICIYNNIGRYLISKNKRIPFLLADIIVTVNGIEYTTLTSYWLKQEKINL